MPAEATGVIHDLGYQRYDGGRLGRAQIARTLYWYSLRAAFGLGRGAKAKILPVGVFALMCAPALVSAVVVARGGTRPVPYDTYIFALRVVAMTIFVAAQAPELVSRDLRCRVLPLYFARPLHRGDYPLAKFAALLVACLAMIEIPLLLLYVGTISSLHSGSAIWAETRALVPGLLIGLLWSVTLAVIGLAIASLSGRRAYATGAIAVFFFLSWSLAQFLIVAGGDGSVGQPTLAGLVSPFTLLDGVRLWLGGTNKGPVPAVGGYGAAYGLVLLALLAGAAAVLAARYRKEDAA
jgi:ABC-2 type transport system permease protein